MFLQGMVFAFLPPLCPGAGCGCAPRGGDLRPGAGGGSRRSEHRAHSELVVCRVPAGTGSRAFAAGACSPSPRGITAPLCVVSPARRLGWRWLPPAQVEPGWGSLGWIWLRGSTGSLVGGGESPSPAAPWNAEPGLVRALPARRHPRCGAMTAARLTSASPSTQNHPKSPGSALQAMPGAPTPQHGHPHLTIAPAVPPSHKSQ